MRKTHRPQRRTATRKARLLAVAKTVFERDGYFNVGMRQLAAEAKVSLATPYDYFGDKEGLYRAAVEQEPPNFDSFVALVLNEAQPESALAIEAARIHLAIFGSPKGE